MLALAVILAFVAGVAVGYLFVSKALAALKADASKVNKVVQNDATNIVKKL